MEVACTCKLHLTTSAHDFRRNCPMPLMLLPASMRLAKQSLWRVTKGAVQRSEETWLIIAQVGLD